LAVGELRLITFKIHALVSTEVRMVQLEFLKEVRDAYDTNNFSTS